MCNMNLNTVEVPNMSSGETPALTDESPLVTVNVEDLQAVIGALLDLYDAVQSRPTESLRAALDRMDEALSAVLPD